MASRRSFTRLATTSESHRVTTLELFFDLVFVFAFTQVTGFMADSHGAFGVLQGLTMLAYLWWSWTSYSWLANQTRVDVGIARAGFSVALAAMFIVSLAIPEAFADRQGALVFSIAYFVVRLVHGFTYLAAAWNDPGLRRQLYRSVWSMLAGVAAMFAGALIGGRVQAWFWLGGIALDIAITYLVSRRGGWRVQSAAHWTERYGLVVMLALGESIVEVGVGLAGETITPLVIVAALLAVALSVALWWMYFDIVSIAAERYLAKLTGVERADLATEGYTYLHFSLIAGIIITALGLEQAVTHLAGGHPLGLFGAAALFGGTSLYVAGHAMFWRRVSGTWLPTRLIGATVLLALVPVGAAVPAFAALAIASLGCVAIVVIETIRYARERSTLRD
jgi:low temperature requirement protein LtrA